MNTKNASAIVDFQNGVTPLNAENLNPIKASIVQQGKDITAVSGVVATQQTEINNLGSQLDDMVNELDVVSYCSPNKIDKNNLINGKYIDYLTGNEVVNASYYCTDFIKINDVTKYIVSKSRQLAFYDSKKIYISGRTTTDEQSFITPEGALYIRVSIYNTDIDTFQLAQGDVLPPYESYGRSIKLNNLNKEIIDELNKKAQLSPSRNLFDKKTIVNGKYVNGDNGNLYDNSTYFTSDYISIEGNLKYSISYSYMYAFYDNTLKYISGVGETTNKGKNVIITTPNNAKYIRLSCYTTLLNSFQFEEGDIMTNYVSHEPTLNKINIDNNIYPVIRLQDIASKIPFSALKIKIIGDSITAGSGGTGYSPTGEAIFGSYKANEVGHCWANNLRDCIQSKYSNVVVKNWE